jgi:hypothetical protein
MGAEHKFQAQGVNCFMKSSPRLGPATLDLANFDWVRFGHKEKPLLVFKPKSTINVDELVPIQH